MYALRQGSEDVSQKAFLINYLMRGFYQMLLNVLLIFLCPNLIFYFI